jgi:transposase
MPALGDIRIEVRRGNTAIKVDWPVQASGDCATWLRDWLR